MTVLKNKERKNCSWYIKSSDSIRTVAVRAIVPANDRKKVMKASYPVDLFWKVCKICGTRVIKINPRAELATKSQCYSSIRLASKSIKA